MALNETSGPCGELHGSSGVAGGELDGTSDPGGELEEPALTPQNGGLIEEAAVRL